MAIEQIGAAVADWDTKTDVLFPAVDVKEGNGYLFFIRAQTAGQVLTQQYVNLIALIFAGGQVYETPLEAKFFPKDRTMMFGVGVPDIDEFKDSQVRILGLPREFYPGVGLLRQVNLILSWEEKQEFDAKSVGIG